MYITTVMFQLKKGFYSLFFIKATYNFSVIFSFSITCLRPDLYWSFGTTIRRLPTILFRKRFPLHPISVDCINTNKNQQKLMFYSRGVYSCLPRGCLIVYNLTEIEIQVTLSKINIWESGPTNGTCREVSVTYMY